MRFRVAAVVALTVALGTVVGASPAHAASESPGGQGFLDTPAIPTQPNVPGASVSFAITNTTCFSNAITFTATTQENGFSGVQQFKQTAVEQEFTNVGWVNITGKSVVKSQKFPNDARNFRFAFDWRSTHPANGASHRVIWQGFYLNGFGGVLFKTKPIKVNCL